MKRFAFHAVPVVLGALFLASCNGSSSGNAFLGNLPGPNTPSAFTRMFDAICNDNKIYIIAPPIASPLTPAGSFAQPCSYSLAFNANGVLAVSSNLSGGAVRIYNPPYSSSTTPTVTISGGTSTLTRPTGIAWDGAGNVWTADAVSAVKEFTAPFSAGSAPAATNTTTATPVGLAINPAAQLMFISDGGDGFGCTTSCHVYVVPAPYTGVPTATFAFGSSKPAALATDLLGRLFVGFDFGGANAGLIKVYLPPFATGNSAAYTLTVGSPIENLAFDSAQNLYVQLASGSVVVFNGPVLGSYAAPSAVLGCPTGSASCNAGNQWAGLGFGP